jgi:hypothetical protein
MEVLEIRPFGNLFVESFPLRWDTEGFLFQTFITMNLLYYERNKANYKTKNNNHSSNTTFKEMTRIGRQQVRKSGLVNMNVPYQNFTLHTRPRPKDFITLGSIPHLT